MAFAAVVVSACPAPRGLGRAHTDTVPYSRSSYPAAGAPCVRVRVYPKLQMPPHNAHNDEEDDGMICENVCTDAFDGVCDDGGGGAVSTACQWGHDCHDLSLIHI